MAAGENEEIHLARKGESMGPAGLAFLASLAVSIGLVVWTEHTVTRCLGVLVFGGSLFVLLRKWIRRDIVARLDSVGVHDKEGTIPWAGVQGCWLRMPPVSRSTSWQRQSPWGRDSLHFSVSRDKYARRGNPHDEEWPALARWDAALEIPRQDRERIRSCMT